RSCRFRRSCGPGGLGIRDAGEPAAAELGAEAVEDGADPTFVVEHRLCRGSRLHGERTMVIALERGDPQARQAALDQAEDVAFPSELPVALGELEAVTDLGSRLAA